jgi:outer membrane lipoprotein SlyB
MSGRLRETQNYRAGVWRAASFTFTFTFASALAGASLLSFGLAGCASRVAPASGAIAAVQAPAASNGPAYAIVDSVRPIAPGANPQGDILTAMGVPAPAGGASACEILVWTEDGETLSVVQANAAGLRPGERVIVLPGAIPRLMVPQAASPAS